MQILPIVKRAVKGNGGGIKEWVVERICISKQQRVKHFLKNLKHLSLDNFT